MCVNVNTVRDAKSFQSFFNMYNMTSVAFFTGIDGYKATTSYETCISFIPIDQVFASSTNVIEFLILTSFLFKRWLNNVY